MTAVDVVKVYLGLGANLGDATAIFIDVASSIKSSALVSFVKASSIYSSRPWGGNEVDLSKQNDYLNQVIEIETSKSATDLLEYTQSLELLAGRDPSTKRWAARPLDIDILLYGNQFVALHNLQIPHPRILERSFVMLPLLELGADLKLLDLVTFVKVQNKLCSIQQLEKDDIATKRYNSRVLS